MRTQRPMSTQPIILALDASTDACSAAISIDGCFISRYELAARSHTQRMLPLVDELLQEADIRLNDVDAIAYGAGPGSFTGLRICLGFVQGLAFSVNKPVIPISSLAMVANAMFKKYECRDVTVIQDARMGEVYLGRWILEGDNCISHDGDRLLKPEDIKLYDSSLLVGQGQALLPLQTLDEFTGSRIIGDVYPNAKDALPLALDAFCHKQWLNPNQAEPTYLRNEVSWKKRIKKSDH